MISPLHRLYRTKLTLLAWVLAVSGVGLLVFAKLAKTSQGPGWDLLNNLPLTDIGSALFTTGLIGVALQYFDAKDADERANERLRKVLKEEAPAIRDAVADGFAFSPEAVTSVASPETLDKVVRNCLALQLGDAEMAEDLYRDLRQEAQTPADRRYDSRVGVTLSRFEQGPTSERQGGHVRRHHSSRVRRSVGSMLRFACVADSAEYAALLRDPATADVWQFQPTAELSADSTEAFELLEVLIDGLPCDLRRSARKGSQTFTARMHDGQSFPGSEVHVSYTYRVLVQQHSHLLYLDVARPTRGFSVDLWYADCGISYMNALEFLAGPQATRVSRMPTADGQGNVSMSYDGWVFPKSGIAFCWVLRSELDKLHKDDAPTVLTER